MVDSHCHLYDEKIVDRCDEIINNFKTDNIDYVIVPSCDLDSINKAYELCKKHPQVFSALAVHPHEASSYDDECEKIIKSRSKDEKVVAIGEFGLDYFYNCSPANMQMEVMEKQLIVCNEVDLPAIFHIRDGEKNTGSRYDAYTDFFSAVKNCIPNRSGVLHCFSGDKQKAGKALDLGFYISFTCNVTYKTYEHLRQALEYIPLDRLLIETDSPYLSPRKMRDLPNEPKNVTYVAECFAEVKHVSIDEVLEQTKENTETLFYKIKNNLKG